MKAQFSIQGANLETLNDAEIGCVNGGVLFVPAAIVAVRVGVAVAPHAPKIVSGAKVVGKTAGLTAVANGTNRLINKVFGRG